MESDNGNTRSWVLETKHLSRVVSGKRVVEDISIQVERGDVVAIVGPSGSGKSSFLRLINRLDEPTSGTVFLEGTDYHDIPPRQLRRRIGMMTQTAFLFPGTVADNLRFGPHQQGNELSDEAISRLLVQVGLAGQAHSDVSHLSGGEAQRVSLARALANVPLVLLLDEPTSALDEAIKQEVESLILQVVRQNSLTCLMVTHDPAQAARVAVHVLLLKNGTLARMGPAKEVLDAETPLH
jgi:ABC-type cobalamin/Fe3+-siderophores transport system ATPase subunit